MNPASTNSLEIRGYRPPIHQNIVQEQASYFASALAHEVRNPLSSINLSAEMLKSTLLDQDQRLYLDIIMRGASKINDLIKALLLSFEPKEILQVECVVSQLLDEVLFEVKDRLTLKNISIRKDYTTIDCKVLVIRQEILIALTNIIINSIDAMPSEKGELKLITKSINGKCVIEIEDNGIGISKENLLNIFKPYFTNKLSGMGLGLSTTLDILHTNHVKVEVKSEIGMGTRFILSFNAFQQIEELF